MKFAFLLFALLSSQTPVTFAQTPQGNGATPAIKRIVFVGDSITAGVGVKNPKEERYATVTTRLLEPSNPGITEINLAQSGRALCHQNANHQAGILKHDPDAVVVQWGVNDHFWGFSVAEFVTRYDGLVAALRAAKPDMVIVVVTLIADFRWPENQDAWIGEANVALQEIAARYGCHLADAHRAIDHQKKLYADNIHPNAAGAAVIADTITAALRGGPTSIKKPRLSFDRGPEVRFLQYVFLPKAEDGAPHWVNVSDISPEGMILESKIPITVRTAPIYQAGNYRIRIRDKAGEVLEDSTAPVNFSKMLQFTINPGMRDGPFHIEITREGTPQK